MPIKYDTNNFYHTIYYNEFSFLFNHLDYVLLLSTCHKQGYSARKRIQVGIHTRWLQ